MLILSEQQTAYSGRIMLIQQEKQAKEIMQTFPQEWGYTASQQAAIVGCSVDTIFEARHEMDE